MAPAAQILSHYRVSDLTSIVNSVGGALGLTLGLSIWGGVIAGTHTTSSSVFLSVSSGLEHVTNFVVWMIGKKKPAASL